MKILKTGIPFIGELKGSIIVQGIFSGEKNRRMQCYYIKDKKISKGFVEDLFNMSSLMVNPIFFNKVHLYAKIKSVERSIDFFGMRQRREGFLYSALPIIGFNYVQEANVFHFTLLTDRPDVETLKMLREDLIFLFPITLKDIQ